MIALIHSNCVGFTGVKFSFHTRRAKLKENPIRVLFQGRWHKVISTEYKSPVDGHPMERHQIALRAGCMMEATVTFHDDSGVPLDRLPR